LCGGPAGTVPEQRAGDPIVGGGGPGAPAWAKDPLALAAGDESAGQRFGDGVGEAWLVSGAMADRGVSSGAQERLSGRSTAAGEPGAITQGVDGGHGGGVEGFGVEPAGARATVGASGDPIQPAGTGSPSTLVPGAVKARREALHLARGGEGGGADGRISGAPQ